MSNYSNMTMVSFQLVEPYFISYNSFNVFLKIKFLGILILIYHFASSIAICVNLIFGSFVWNITSDCSVIVVLLILFCRDLLLMGLGVFPVSLCSLGDMSYHDWFWTPGEVVIAHASACAPPADSGWGGGWILGYWKSSNRM